MGSGRVDRIVYNPMVRVKVEVEELVEEVARALGYHEFSIRNVAILYGLATILLAKRVPDSDAEFLELLEEVRTLVKLARGGSRA